MCTLNNCDNKKIKKLKSTQNPSLLIFVHILMNDLSDVCVCVKEKYELIHNFIFMALSCTFNLTAFFTKQSILSVHGYIISSCLYIL